MERSLREPQACRSQIETFCRALIPQTGTSHRPSLRAEPEFRSLTNGGPNLERSAVSIPAVSPFKATAFYQQVQELQPSNDLQRSLKQRIVQVALDLGQSRLLLFSHLGSSIPLPFLVVLLLWMVILFAGFSVIAPANAVTLASLVVCAVSVSGAIFLILALDRPFSGLMMIPSESLLNALPPLNA